MANRKSQSGTPKSVAAKPVSAPAKPVLPIKPASAKTPVVQPVAKAATAPKPAPAVKADPAPAPRIETPAVAAPAAPVIAQQIKEGTETMNDQIKKTVETGKQAAQQTAERVQAAFGDINERTKTAMERNAKMMEEMSDLTKGNVEAIVASGRTAAQGFQTLGQEAADFGRRSFEEASATLKSFAEVKSPTDFFRLQSDYARSAFDSMIAESSKMSESMIKLAGEVAEPITNRAAIAADKVKAFAA